MIKIKPFLKWAGNKYRCLDNILNAFPTANRLIEPFTGSAAVFMNANYPAYLLGEENHDLVILFQHLQREGESFIAYCEQFFCSINNSKQHYYQLRDQFNRCNDQRKRAAMFLYLNRHGYNGLCRYNSKGGYNVPFGRYVKPYFPRTEMSLFHEKSQRATFVHHDFRETFSRAEPGDLIYCDPPYAPIVQRSNFSAYTHKKFGSDEQIALAKLAKDTASRGITVIISNHDTDVTRQYYQSADIKTFQVKRLISCQSINRKPANELIAIFR